MATRAGKGVYVYIKEHMDAQDVSDDEMADRLHLSSRSAVWKLYTEQQRLNIRKIRRFADALGLSVQQLLYPPGTQSLDAIVEDATPAEREKAAEMLRLWLGKAP